ncbi:TetR/AcrR family transcriptional regulator [Catenulispora sp. GAS73]|uniref:TetR/AcrR family transcriptional regulator n=1 Tax=Catenulispora sp. GAS73 TaxID=3156269 RepID=UPI003519BE3C
MALRAPGTEPQAAKGLRERRKHATRQLLVDTATEMFLERGFDAVTVAEIAEVCEVSPTTVFNYFPTKESLVLDLPGELLAALETSLADPKTLPLEAMLQILAGELDNLISWLEAQHDQTWAANAVQRFEAMVRDTPTLRAHHRNMLQQMTDAACRILADRAMMDASDPEPQIAAAALLGLWSIQVNSSCKHLDGRKSPAQVRQAVTAEVRRAARLLDTGLSSFAVRGEGMHANNRLQPRPNRAS